MRLAFNLPLAAAAIIVLGVSPVFAGDLCETTGGPIKTEDEVRAMLTEQGYEVRSVEEEHGCLEAKGKDRDGNRVEVYVHPNTGEIVKVKTS